MNIPEDSPRSPDALMRLELARLRRDFKNPGCAGYEFSKWMISLEATAEDWETAANVLIDWCIYEQERAEANVRAHPLLQVIPDPDYDYEHYAHSVLGTVLHGAYWDGLRMAVRALRELGLIPPNQDNDGDAWMQFTSGLACAHWIDDEVADYFKARFTPMTVNPMEKG